MRAIIPIILVIICTSYLLPQTEYNEVFYLKNGSIIKGIIIETIPNKSFKIQTKDGNIFVFTIDEIEKITKEKTEAILINNDNAYANERILELRTFDQTIKGTIYLGGEIYFIYYASHSYSYNQLSFAPIVGYFFTDNLLLGISLSYSYYKDNRTSWGFFNIRESNSQSQFGIGPIIRYYFGSGANKPFTYSIIGYSTSKSYWNVTFGLGIGYSIAISKNVAVNPVVQYDFVIPEGGEFGDIKEFYVGVGISIFVF